MDETRPLLDEGQYPPYDHSKAKGEKIVMEAIEKGLDAIIINPSGMLGPNDFKPSYFGTTIIEMAKGKLPALVNAGLSWVDIRDVADGMIKACEQAKPGAKYFLSGNWITLKEIARQVVALTGVKKPQIVVPMWLAKTSAPAAMFFGQIRGRRTLFTPISMKELESNPDISHARASKELGYQPRPIEQTISDTMAWFKTNGYLS